MFEGEYSRRDVDLRCAPSNDAETRLAYHSHEVGCSTFCNNSSGFWCSDHIDVDSEKAKRMLDLLRRAWATIFVPPLLWVAQL